MQRRWLSPRRWRLQTSLVLTVAILAALLVLVTMAVERALLQERLGAELQNAAAVGRIAGAEVDRFLRDVESTTLALARGLSGEPFSQTWLGGDLRQVRDSLGVLRALFVTDLQGHVVASASGEGIGLDLSGRPYVAALRSGAESVWSDVQGVQTGQPTVAFARPIHGQNGVVRGYLVAAFSPPAMMASLTRSLPADARVTLIDRHGILFYTSTGPLPPPAQRDLSGRPNIQRALRGEIVMLYGPRAPTTQDARYGALVPLAHTGWVLAFSRPLDPLEARIRAPLGRQRRLLVGAILLAGGLTLAVSLRLVRPLGRLAQAAGAIARGERPTLPEVTGPSEVTDLAAGMSAMSRAVAGREEALRFLAEAAKELSGSLDHEAILRNLARLAVPRVADWCIIYVLGADGVLRRLEVRHSAPGEDELVRTLSAQPIEAGGAHPILEVMRTGRSQLLTEISEEMLRRAAPGEEQFQQSQAFGFTSAMLVPLVARGRAVGAIAFVTAQSRRRYTEVDLGMAEELAQRAALAVENARVYERERSTAETLQRSLLPSALPAIPGLALASRYLPAQRESEVGGDWYDAVAMPDGSLALVMGDVAGRGIQAAAVMGQLQNAVRAYAAEGHGPGAILQRVARMLDLDEMATVLIFTFEPVSSSARYANAGHLPPLVRSPGGAVRLLTDGGAPPLGPPAETAYAETTVVLEPGSTVLLFTDGLVEVRGEPIDLGLDRLVAAVRAGPVDADALLTHVVGTLLGAEAAADDAALLALHVGALDPAHLHLRLDASPGSAPLLRHTLQRWLAQSAVPPDERFAITVGVTEAFSNAIEHAYGAGSAAIEVDGRRQGDLVTVTVRDWGRWRDRRGRDRGRGLLLMRELMDDVEIEPGAEGTTVRLRRRIRQEVPA